VIDHPNADEWISGLLVGATLFVAVMVLRALWQYRRDRRNAERRNRRYAEIERRITEERRAWGVSVPTPLAESITERPRRRVWNSESLARYKRKPVKHGSSWPLALVFVAVLMAAAMLAIALSK
jgi:cytochrome c-type biogenesis protein CcmH/NrfG